MKIMCPPGYYRNSFAATHALGHMMYGYGFLLSLLSTLWFIGTSSL